MEMSADTRPDVQDTTTAVPEKKKRKRLKKLCGQIRQQMEFYFSDANLRQDRFLKKQIDQSTDGSVELSIFANFNKLKTMTTDMKLVAKALSSSELLKVSEDKKRVWRVTPLAEAPDVDDKTVYVECLPATADHEYLRKVFSSCGPVAYVSLPKYRSTGDIKGFAFIEFESKDSAEKACELLNNPPASASSKPGKFPKGSKQFQNLARQVEAQKESTEDGDPDAAKGKKRKRSRSGSDSAGDEKVETPKKGRKRKTSQCESGGEESVTTPTKRRPSQMDRISPKEEKRKKLKEKKRKQSDDADADADADANISKRAKLSATDAGIPAEPTKIEDSENKDSGAKDPVPIKQESIMKKDTTDGEDSRAARKRRSDGGEGLEKKVRISEKVEVKVTEEEGKKKKVPTATLR